MRTLRIILIYIPKPTKALSKSIFPSGCDASLTFNLHDFIEKESFSQYNRVIVKKVILLNKKEGETPLETLQGFRDKNSIYKKFSMTYAGRLDPMASGLLLILVGKEIKNKAKYLALKKEYNFEILFGFATDTYDILGKVIRHNTLSRPRESVMGCDLDKNIRENLKYFKGKFVQKYPPYSSKTVNGKQLFSYARDNIAVKLPEREVVVDKLSLLKIKSISNKQLLNNIERRIRKVKGDFRQKEILKIWSKYLLTKKSEKFFVASFKVKCSSGTYVRDIANSLGDKMGIFALAFSIKRTKIGKWRQQE